MTINLMLYPVIRAHWHGSTGDTTLTSWKGLGVACDLCRVITFERERVQQSEEGTVGKLRLSSSSYLRHMSVRMFT